MISQAQQERWNVPKSPCKATLQCKFRLLGRRSNRLPPEGFAYKALDSSGDWKVATREIHVPYPAGDGVKASETLEIYSLPDLTCLLVPNQRRKIQACEQFTWAILWIQAKTSLSLIRQLKNFACYVSYLFFTIQITYVIVTMFPCNDSSLGHYRDCGIIMLRAY